MLEVGSEIESAARGIAVRERVNGTLKRLSKTGALPTLPPVASAALSLARDPDADIDRICKIIQTDLGLAARVLRLANSAAIGRRTPARRLMDAVITVGLRKTCDVLVAAAVRHLYDMEQPEARALWDHSLATAVASEELARRTRLADPGRAFLPGLFHDVGRVAFLLADELSYEVLERLAEADEGDRCSLERDWYGFDHASGGAVLVEEWGLALEQCDAVRFHHSPEDAGAARDLAVVVAAADFLSYSIGCGAGGVPPDEEVIARVGLSLAEETSLSHRILELFQEQKELLE